MTTTRTTGASVFESRTKAVLDELDATGQLKHLQMIEGPMGPRITLRDRGEVDVSARTTISASPIIPTWWRRVATASNDTVPAQPRCDSSVELSRMNIWSRRSRTCSGWRRRYLRPC